jgi:hypothetical protein
MNRFHQKESGVCFFEFCTYIPGLVLPQLQPDLTAENANHSCDPIPVAEGTPASELVHVAEVLAFGNILIVESVRGMGGLSLLCKYIYQMARRYIDKGFPSVTVLDLVSDDLKRQIEKSGGVESLTLRFAESKHEGFKFSETLDPTKNLIPNTSFLSITWDTRNGDLLDEDAVMKAYNEADSDEPDIENIIIRFADGTTQTGLSKYKVRRRVTVSDIGGKNPNRFEIRTELAKYLIELMDTGDDGKRTLTSEGYYIRHEV